jgi:hypothetical protein
LPLIRVVLSFVQDATVWFFESLLFVYEKIPILISLHAIGFRMV